MSCFWLRTGMESCQIDCCLIILVWRVCHCDTNIRTKTHESCNRHSNTFIQTGYKNTCKPWHRHKMHVHTQKYGDTKTLTHFVSALYTRDSRWQTKSQMMVSPGSPHLAACLFSLVCQIAKAIESQQTRQTVECVDVWLAGWLTNVSGSFVVSWEQRGDSLSSFKLLGKTTQQGYAADWLHITNK